MSTSISTVPSSIDNDSRLLAIGSWRVDNLDVRRSWTDRVDRNLSILDDIPMLILWGRHDFVFDVDYYNMWRRRFPTAESHLFDDAGHYLLEDVPERIIGLVKDFLERHPLS